MNKNILVINGNPKSESFCKVLAGHYIKSSEQGNDVRLISINSLSLTLI
ncbi:NAD(P)H-dependent oxidoreductase [Photobacterium sanguinicancri]|nr:NAD(P)H-dependent oxidoreductase [Photobacterium sanguinicancri]